MATMVIIVRTGIADPVAEAGIAEAAEVVVIAGPVAAAVVIADPVAVAAVADKRRLLRRRRIYKRTSSIEITRK